jgi:hypothetical protein
MLFIRNTLINEKISAIDCLSFGEFMRTTALSSLAALSGRKEHTIDLDYLSLISLTEYFIETLGTIRTKGDQ